MARYAYKEVRDLLIRHGKLDEYGDPVDKDTHGENLTVDYDGNIHDIASELIEELETEIKTLKEAQK
jgi:hypothetical protein